ncbi:MAG: hypothetical protein K6F77_00865 [Lachnospiraceae bacterium]|nr:hypothetical protein [Lachnospiraceae bacterium]
MGRGNIFKKACNMKNRYVFDSTNNLEHDCRPMAKKEYNFKGGFTLVELLVIIAVMTIVLGVSVVGALGWIAHSKQKENEEAARVIFMAAQSKLANSMSRGTYEDLEAELNKYSTDISNANKETLGLPTEKDNEGVEHNYVYLKVDKGDYLSSSQTASEKFLFNLISSYVFDSSILDGSFVVEFDITAGTVHSVFYSRSIKEFKYATDSNGISVSFGNYYIDAEGRTEAKLEDKAIGYYSANQVNSAKLSSTNLRLTTLSLNNDETLNLRFGSNSVNQDLDTSFDITFYQKKDGDVGQVMDSDHELFTTTVTYGVFDDETMTTSNGKVIAFSDLPIRLSGSDSTLTTMPFLISYNGSTFELVLDAKMTAEKMALLIKDSEDGINSKEGLSVTRLAELKKMNALNAAFSNPIDIFATVQIDVNTAFADQEYSVGASVTSSTENTMFATTISSDTDDADGSSSSYDVYKIAKNRHLSNVRFMEKLKDNSSEKNKYVLITNLNWNSNIIYDINSYVPVNATEAVFPTIKSLSKGSILDGGGFMIQNLRLGYGSNVDYGSYDSTGNKNGSTYTNKATSVGLVGENDGVIRNFYFNKSMVSITDGETGVPVSPYLKSIGLVAGKNTGNINNLYFYSTCGVNAFIDYQTATDVTRTDGAGIGMVAGTMALDADEGSSSNTTEKIYKILIKGTVNGEIVNAETSSAGFTETSITGENDNDYKYAGIGSICGYLAVNSADAFIGHEKTDNDGKLNNVMKSGLSTLAKKAIINQADVEGNMFTGGLVGNLNTTVDVTTNDYQLMNIHNEGFISAQTNPSAELIEEFEKEDAHFTTLDGFFTGGVVGYAYNSTLTNCTYTMKNSSKIAAYSNSSTAHSQLIADAKGFFVGGIIGYSDTSNVQGCRTMAGGYLVGYDYVGGITGGMKSDDVEAATSTDSHYVLISGNTSNKAYVIGHSFVGGISGSNRAGSKIVDCSNDGAVAGYGIDIGGIVGKNVGTDEKEALISNCTSTLYDYGSEVFSLVKDVWQFFGSNVGGQVGFNKNGTVEYSGDLISDDETTVSSVSVGKNNVGGFIGYNAENGNLDMGDASGYVSGRVYGTGDCVGGFIGLNAEPTILKKKITVSTNNIEGRYIVGGIIGANIIKPSENVVFKLKYDNPISKVTGTSVVGGTIGYNMLVTNTVSDKISSYDTEVDDFYQTFITIDSSSKVISDANVLTANTNYLMSITGDGSGTVFNNAEVSATTYGGGIIGVNNEDTMMRIYNVINEGDISEIGSTSDKIKLSEFAGDAVDRTYVTGIIGGIVGFNNTNTVIDRCKNKGSLEFKYAGYGSIVGMNEGYILNCELASNIGKNNVNILGGIVGINYDGGKKTAVDFTDFGFSEYQYYPGTVEDCIKNEGTSLTGGGIVGGIVGLNIQTEGDDYNGGIVVKCDSYGEINGKTDVGGFVGVNMGSLKLRSQSLTTKELTVKGKSNVGGFIGRNTCGATSATEETEVGYISYVKKACSYGEGMTITVKATTAYAGGIVGYLEYGAIEGTSNYYIENHASVEAVKYAGGIIGRIKTDYDDDINNSDKATISYVENYGDVTSTEGYAGGILPVNDIVLKKCTDKGNVKSSGTFAGGITAVNNSQIIGCEVSANGETGITISSNEGIGGAIVAENATGKIVRGCIVGDVDSSDAGDVTVSGKKLACIGLAIGTNSGEIRNIKIYPNVKVRTNKSNVVLGGVVGRNTADGYINYEDGEIITDSSKAIVSDATLSEKTCLKVESTDSSLNNVKYLGGIVGENLGHVALAGFSGQIGSSSFTATPYVGTAFGGIAGINKSGGVITKCYISGADMQIKGMFAANNSQSSAEKLESSAFIGGIAGLNAKGGQILNSYIDENEKTNSGSATKIYITNGMAGGISGANAGTIKRCGYSDDMAMVDDVVKLLYTENTRDLTTLKKNFGRTDAKGYSKYYDIDDNDKPDNLAGTITTIKLSTGKGYIGGITGYNAQTGVIEESASGKWMVYCTGVQDENSYVGGVIGINETDKDLLCNINNAFVCRKQTSSITRMYAGGIMALQSNRTSSDWTVDSCINCGVVKEYLTHNVAGIAARWINNGGTFERCMNFGALYTNRQAGSQGTAAGIVGFVNALTSGQTINILSCQNHGAVNIPVGSGIDPTKSLSGQTPKAYTCANDVSGIVAELNAPNATEILKINIVDCVNGKDAIVIGYSQGDGMVSWIGGDTGVKTDTVICNINRCRNYSDDIRSFNNSNTKAFSRNRTAGIFGCAQSPSTFTNYKGYISIRNCFNINNTEQSYSNYNNFCNGRIIGSNKVNAVTTDVKMFKNCGNNYYMDYYSFYYKSSTTLSVGEAECSNRIAKDDVDQETCTYVFDTEESRVGYPTRIYAVKDTDESDSSKIYKAVLDYDSYNLAEFSSNNAWYDTSSKTIKSKLASGLFNTSVTTTNVASMQFEFEELDGNSKASAKDIEDEDIQEFFANVVDAESLSPVTSLTLAKSEGKYKLSWTDPNTATEYYSVQAEAYKVAKGATFNVDNLGSYTKVENSDVDLVSYQTDIEFTLPDEVEIDAGYDYYVVARVKPQNSNVAISASVRWSDYAYVSAQNIMTKPDLEVIRYKDKWYLHLKNADEFPSDTDWVVTAKTIDGYIKNVQIKKSNSNTSPLPYCVALSHSNQVDSVLRATAKDNSTNTTYMESELFSSNVFIPTGYIPASNYNIYVLGANGDGSIVPSGKSSEDFSFEIQLKTHDSFAYQPEFRVELYGTDNNKDSETYGKVVTFASQLIALNNTNYTTVTFDSTNLPTPDELENYSDIHFVAYYASTGLGPVYNYYEVPESLEASVKSNATGYTRKEGYIYDKFTESYIYANPVNSSYRASQYKNNNYFEGAYSIDFLDKPVLNDEGTYSINDDDKMTYTFKWDEDNRTSDTYEIKAYGLVLADDTDPDSDVVTEVKEDLSDYYTNTDRYVTVATNDWDYDAIRLEVYGQGGTVTNNVYYLGRMDKENYIIPRRLPKLEAPHASLVDQDGIVYDISWSGDVDEEYTVGYNVVVLKDGERTIVGTTDDITATKLRVDLEQFSGEDVKIYVVALADPEANGNKVYNSPAGTTTSLSVISRLDRPDVKFSWNEELTEGDYVSEEDFASESSKLFANVTGDSKLNGSYLFYGILYETEEEAQADLNTLNQLLSGGLSGNELNSSIMTTVEDLVTAARLYSFGFDSRRIGEDEGSTSSPFAYSLSLEKFGNSEEEWSLEYAGRYLLPFLRATGNTSVSSAYGWNSNEILRLPVVKFDAPNITKTVTEREMTGNVYDIAKYINPKQEITSTLEFETYSWSRTDKCPDSFDFVLNLNTNKLDSEGSVATWADKVGLSIFTEEVEEEVDGETVTNEYFAADITKIDGDEKTHYTRKQIIAKAEAAIESGVESRVTSEGAVMIYYDAIDDDGNPDYDNYYTIEETDGYKAYGVNGDIFFVEKLIGDDAVKLNIPGYTNYISGTVNYDGSNYTHYLFSKALTVTYEENEDEYNYSIVVPKPSGSFTFEVINELGNTYECTATYLGDYITEGTIITSAEEDSEQYITSDEIKIENDTVVK